MSEPIPSDILQQFAAWFADPAPGASQWAWLEEMLELHPPLAQIGLPDGRLPLRVLLQRRAPPGLISRLVTYGAEQDIISATATADLSTVKKLLDAEPWLIDDKDADDNTPLHWACENHCRGDYEEVVSLLVSRRADIAARNAHGLTPLDIDLLDGQGQACEILVEQGAVPTVLFGLVTEDIELLENLLDDNPDLIHWQDPRDGRCLLHVAVRWESEAEMIDYLLAKGARREIDVRARFGRARKTPLLHALSVRAYEAAEVFIRNGADVNAREEHIGSRLPSRSPLRIAVDEDRIGLTELLIRHGADVHERDAGGNTLLGRAASAEVADLLIAAGIDPAAEDETGHNSLDHAVENGFGEVIRTLIRQGVTPTIFAWAASGECDRVREMLDREPGLIAARTSPDDSRQVSESDTGRIEIPWGSVCGTPLHCAVKTGQLQMVELLLQRGADVNIPAGPNRWTPLHDAVYYTIRHDLRYGARIIRRLAEAGADLTAVTRGDYAPHDIADYLSFDDRSAEIFDLLTALSRERRSASP